MKRQFNRFAASYGSTSSLSAHLHKVRPQYKSIEVILVLGHVQNLGEYKLKQYPPAEGRRELEEQRVCWSPAWAMSLLLCPDCYHSYGSALVPTGGIRVGHVLTFTTPLHPFLPPSQRGTVGATVRRRRAGNCRKTKLPRRVFSFSPDCL